VSSHAAAPDPGLTPAARGLVRSLQRADRGLAVGGAVTLGAATIAFGAGGGIALGSATAVEIFLVLFAGLLVAAAALSFPLDADLPGVATLGLMVVLAGLTGLSIVWSVQPSDSWLEASRTLSYVATFAAGLVLVRVMPHRSAAVVGGVLAAAAAVCGWALMTKVFPGALGGDDVYARLREPFGYWNAVGLEAALGVMPCLWLGTRREGHAGVNALAYPALGLLLVTLALSYSRGGMLALAVGFAFWLWAVPQRRLRSCAVLGVSAVGAASVVAWAFSRDALSEDRVPVNLRAAAGHELGVLVALMAIVLLGAGLAIGFAGASRRWPDEVRRRTGLAVVIVAALVPIAVATNAALSSRGLGGSVSHTWHNLVDPHAVTPANDPSRLTAVASVRARYWNEALKIFKDHPFKGVGAGGYAIARPRYRQDNLEVRHAHGYVVQTLADLGLLGLAVSLAALAAWLVAAARALRLRRRPSVHPPTPDRVALIALGAIVLVFGVHSFVDWTWFVPGNACVALLCAGWVAGYGPAIPVRLPRRLRDLDPARALVAAGAVVIALVVAWSVLQPLRSVNAGDDALAALEKNDLAKAEADAIAARDRNPLSPDPLYVLSTVEAAGGRNSKALDALEEAVHLQPSNPETWRRLADFELYSLNRPTAAARHLSASLYLDPRSATALQSFLDASRRAATASKPAS
jgi:O-antigen ligase/polysaccharide polymerase Wzy-like membrane protein/tetratricopeptide repeat protein